MSNGAKRRLARTAALLAMATAGSRVLGLVREIVMVSYLGLGAGMGAFTIAMKVPNLVRTLLGDTALSAALVPVISGLLEKGREREAWQVTFTVSVSAAGALGLITALGMIFAPDVVKVVAPGWTTKFPETMSLTVSLMRIMFPTVVVMGLAGILMGILNSYNHFALPAIAPIVWNLIIIGVVVFFSGRYGFHALAWGVMLGTLAELLLQVPPVWKRRWRPSTGIWRNTGEQAAADTGLSPWRLSWRSPEVRRVGVLIGPVIISLGIINFNSFVDTVVAALIGEAAPAYIDKAFRLFQLPQGMFAIAIGTVLFPALSRHGAAGRMEDFRRDLSLGVRQIFFVTLPFSAFFLVLSVPTIRLIYEHGQALGDETAILGTASALFFFSVGMAFVSVNTLLNRAFYSIQKTWIPLAMGGANLAINAGLDLLLYKPMGVGGITLSTSVVSIINFIGLVLLLRPRIGGMRGREIARSGGQAFVALIPLAGVSYACWWGLDALLGRALWAQVVSLGIAYMAGGAVYCLGAWAMRMPELQDLLSVIRLRRQTPSASEITELES